MASALAQSEDAVGVLAVFEGGRERAVEDEEEIAVFTGAERYWGWMSVLNGGKGSSLDMAVDMSIYGLRWWHYLPPCLFGRFIELCKDAMIPTQP